MPEPSEPSPDPDLPVELLEAAEQLLAAAPEARASLLEELRQRHREHATTLERMAADLFGIDHLLDAGYGGKAARERPAEPTAIGGYRVLHRLGEGAFGAVYLCAQTAPVRREVAIKVLRPGAGDRNTLQRFDAERQFLARQNHPAITQVFDAGTLPDGRPFFVMEHVPGLPITRYCDERQLTIRDRLRVFERLCNGVQHAHAHGIVHRDLKPANILVVEIDGQPWPKIIDFGIAKALDHETGDAKGHFTETGRVIGTPGYMSPEQALGHRAAIDARTDVFTLGVILYELLTGELPWGHHPTTTDHDPPRPSRRVVTDRERTTTVARQRSAEPRHLASHLRGDLDWIVLRALQRDRANRYASASELAADLQRHLGNEPVLAGPPSLGYRLQKVVRRHRIAAIATAAILVLSVVGWRLLTHYEDRANTSNDDANAAVANLLARANDPDIAGALNAAPLRQLLMQDALSFYDRFLAERPADPGHREGRARTLTSLSHVHWLLGQYPRAVATARDAVADAEELLAGKPDNLKFRGVLGAARRNLGRALFSANQRGDARLEFEKAIEQLERCYAGSPRSNEGLFASTLVELSTTLDATTEGALVASTLDRARRIQEEVVRAEPDSEAARQNLISFNFGLLRAQITNQDRTAAAATLRRMEEGLASLAHVAPRLTVRVHLAAAELALLDADNEAAIERLEEAAPVARRLAEEDPTRAENLLDLADIHERLAREQYSLGMLDEGDTNQRAAIEVTATHVARFPDDHVAKGSLAVRSNHLALVLLARGRRSLLVEAEAAARRADSALAAMPATFAPQVRGLMQWSNLYRLAFLSSAAGKPDTEGVRTKAESLMSSFYEEYGADRSNAVDYAEAAAWFAGRHCDAGRDEAATRNLDLVDALLSEFPVLDKHELRTAEAQLVRARLAARRGDHAVAASCAERAAEAGAGWRGLQAAAEGMRAAAAGAAAAGPTADPLVARYRDRAAELDEAVIADLEPRVQQEPHDLWVVVPLAQARLRAALRLAERGDRAAADALLAPALAALESARAETFATLQDEDLLVRARALAAEPTLGR